MGYTVTLLTIFFMVRVTMAVIGMAISPQAISMKYLRMAPAPLFSGNERRKKQMKRMPRIMTFKYSSTPFYEIAQLLWTRLARHTVLF